MIMIMINDFDNDFDNDYDNEQNKCKDKLLMNTVDGHNYNQYKFQIYTADGQHRLSTIYNNEPKNENKEYLKGTV
jgi:hypothetical protein